MATKNIPMRTTLKPTSQPCCLSWLSKMMQLSQLLRKSAPQKLQWLPRTYPCARLPTGKTSTIVVFHVVPEALHDESNVSTLRHAPQKETLLPSQHTPASLQVLQETQLQLSPSIHRECEEQLPQKCGGMGIHGGKHGASIAQTSFHATAHFQRGVLPLHGGARPKMLAKFEELRLWKTAIWK